MALGDGVTGGMLTLGDGVTGLGYVFFLFVFVILFLCGCIYFGLHTFHSLKSHNKKRKL